MAKILTVFGASGVQGGSVIEHVLNDQYLSSAYRIRGITRDPTSEKAGKLREKGVDIVKGDFSDASSLEASVANATTVFIVTTPSFGPDAVATEYENIKRLADIAVAQGVEYLILSTLPGVMEISGGKYPHVTPFDAKAKAEKYIRGLPVRSAFVSYGFFMENFHTQPFLGPQKGLDNTWVLSRPVSGSQRIPYIAATQDAGKFVGMILAEPDKYAGRTLCAAQALLSLDEIAGILTDATGKNIQFKEVSVESFKQQLPFAPELFADGYSYLEEFGGYFGPETEKLVADAAAPIKHKLITLPEYLQSNPLKLE